VYFSFFNTVFIVLRAEFRLSNCFHAF